VPLWNYPGGRILFGNPPLGFTLFLPGGLGYQPFGGVSPLWQGASFEGPFFFPHTGFGVCLPTPLFSAKGLCLVVPRRAHTFFTGVRPRRPGVLSLIPLVGLTTSPRRWWVVLFCLHKAREAPSESFPAHLGGATLWVTFWGVRGVLGHFFFPRLGPTLAQEGPLRGVFLPRRVPDLSPVVPTFLGQLGPPSAAITFGAGGSAPRGSCGLSSCGPPSLWGFFSPLIGGLYPPTVGLLVCRVIPTPSFGGITPSGVHTGSPVFLGTTLGGNPFPSSGG